VSDARQSLWRVVGPSVMLGVGFVLLETAFSVSIFLQKGRSRATMSLFLTTVRGAGLAC
jgi:hypothetical protein